MYSTLPQYCNVEVTKRVTLLLRWRNVSLLSGILGQSNDPKSIFEEFFICVIKYATLRNATLANCDVFSMCCCHWTNHDTNANKTQQCINNATYGYFNIITEQLFAVWEWNYRLLVCLQSTASVFLVNLRNIQHACRHHTKYRCNSSCSCKNNNEFVYHLDCWRCCGWKQMLLT